MKVTFQRSSICVPANLIHMKEQGIYQHTPRIDQKGAIQTAILSYIEPFLNLKLANLYAKQP